MNLSVQFMTMIAMAVMGIWVGVSVDTYGRFFYHGGRRRWHPVQILTDLFFWAIQGLLVFLVLLYVNEGDVRIYIFLALLCGYAAYRSLIQVFFLSSLERLIKIIRTLVQFIKNLVDLLLIKPVQWLFQFAFTIGKFLLQGIISLIVLIWTILFVPAKWMFGLVLPDAFFAWMKKKFYKVAGIWTKVENIKNKVKSWFFNSD